MKRLTLLAIFAIFQITIVFAQNTDKLYELYNSKNYEKCVDRCDLAIAKDAGFLEAYYIKALCYFEMAQSPMRYEKFTKDPLMETVKTLAALRVQDPDGFIFDENAATLNMIYKYCEGQNKVMREKGKEWTVQFYQRLNRAYNIKTNALENAELYAKSGDYERAMREIAKFYERAKNSSAISAEDYAVLQKAPLLLVNNWMFDDLFSIVENYKDHFAQNEVISQGLRTAMYKVIDTAYSVDDKSHFAIFSEQAVQLYKDDNDFLNYIEMKWLDLIDATAQTFRNTEKKANRTWADTVLLRDTYVFLDVATEIFPRSATLEVKQQSLNREFHVAPIGVEVLQFKNAALEIVNQWRSEEFVCDTGRLVKVFPVQPLQWHDTLAMLAEQHARDMFTYNYTDNIAPDGVTPWDRIRSTYLKGTQYETETGVKHIQALKIGEVLGYGYTLHGVNSEDDMKKVVAAMVQKWLDQPRTQNCVKLYSPEFTYMGMAVYGDKWVLLMADIQDIQLRRFPKK
ncbi:MAG: CAP domain-containing protein [Bacteroidetes bacterium]|nr:CAP domain-containing protein [Bacteroidota bacterium]